MQMQQLVGTERDEVADMVSRLQMAGRRNAAAAETAPVAAHDLDWAAQMQLPREFFDYFVLDRAA